MPEFPPEIFLTIFSFLDARGLTSCQQVCQSFLALINEMVALEYTKELARHGYVDHAVALLPLPYRLDQLREHSNAWNRLDGSTWSEIVSNFPFSQEFSGNVLARRDVPGGPIVFTRLPSSSRSVGQKEWSIPFKSGLDNFQFGMDSSQDLLVLVESEREPNPSFQFRLLFMSSGKAHELASIPILKYAHNVPAHGVVFAMHISGDHLGVEFGYNHVTTADSEIVIWNWKTGHKELYLTGREIYSFAFLTEKHVVVAVSTGTELRLLVVDFIAESSEQIRVTVTNMTHYLTLRLPNLHLSHILSGFTIRCDPSPAWPNQDDSIPFHVHPDEILYPVTLLMGEGLGRYRIIILIPRRTLLAQLRHFVTGTKEVEWSAWGPEGTRILDFRKRAGRHVAWATFGSRFVAFDNDRLEINVYDFNQMTLRREQSSGCPLQYGNPNEILRPPVNQDDPTMLVINDAVLSLIFQEVVRTSLPFRARTVPTTLERKQYFPLMCSPDNIIIVASEYHIFTL
ncbi:hypothetical protein ARMSODRAFT_1078075 [Armillaria solidipes]|uniref:F-box domain-containing protein n=1 Tax=Armillaria solidipes TaxID=1076256 RepID=A0A2H3CP43_9AGAR|nr:hypothetical protein ARMSODRAFT_1078075 [Armillaria solidipes]